MYSPKLKLNVSSSSRKLVIVQYREKKKTESIERKECVSYLFMKDLHTCNVDAAPVFWHEIKFMAC